MPELDIEKGFKFWRDEVEGLEKPEKMVPYIPAIALVGIYTVCVEDPKLRNSYNWRHAVLRSEDAMSGMRASLDFTQKDEIDDTYKVPIDLMKPDEGAALQHVCAYVSLKDGLPHGITQVPANEMFLARTLGYAEHDYGVTFSPLRLSVDGIDALRNNYPLTAQLIGNNS